VFHPFGLAVVGRVAVVLPGSGFEELLLAVGVGGAQRLGGDHPDGGALTPARVQVPGVAQGELGIRGVQGPHVHMAQPPVRPDEHFPQGPWVPRHLCVLLSSATPPQTAVSPRTPRRPLAPTRPHRGPDGGDESVRHWPPRSRGALPCTPPKRARSSPTSR